MNARMRRPGRAWSKSALAVTVGAAGIGVSFFLGTLVGGLARADAWLTAAATALLTVLAAVQLNHEFRVRAEGAKAQWARLRVAVLVAKRGVAAGLASAAGTREWFTTSSERWPDLQQAISDVAALSSDVSDSGRQSGDAALRAFLSAADVVNETARQVHALGSPDLQVARGKATHHLAESETALEALLAECESHLPVAA